MKLAVYSACIGTRSDLRERPHEESEADYIAFRDTPIEMTTWQVVEVRKENNLTDRQQARRYKALPQMYLPGYDYSIWIDSSMVPHANIIKLIDTMEKYKLDLGAFRHPRRKCAYEEAKVCKGLTSEVATPRDDPHIISKQMERYKDEGFPEDMGLLENGLLVRKHTDKTAETCKVWYEEILGGTHKDQISLMYAIWKTNISVGFFSPGSAAHNPYITYVGHAR